MHVDQRPLALFGGGSLYYSAREIWLWANGLAPPWAIVPPLLFGLAAVITAWTNHLKTRQALHLERERHDAELMLARRPPTAKFGPLPR